MIARFKELRDTYIAPKYPYKHRLVLKSNTNLKVLTSKAINQLGLSSSVFGDKLLKEEDIQLGIINLLIVFGRISTNVMIKSAYAHTLYSDSSFWQKLSLDFSVADITEDEFKQWYSKLLIRLSLGWGFGKVNTAVSIFNTEVKGKINTSDIIVGLQNKLLEDARAILELAATDGTADFTSSVSEAIVSPVDGDSYLDNSYQDVLDSELETYLNLHNITFEDNDLELLALSLFKPNNDPLNPTSTINAEKKFAAIQTVGAVKNKNAVELETVVASTSTKAAQTSSEVPLYKNTGWFLEWAPSQLFGVVAVPIEVAYPEKLPLRNVLAIKDYEVTKRLETYLADVNYLPLSSAHMVVLQDFQISRRTIVNTNVTLASKYVQTLTENFPQFSLKISAVRFGNIHERVLNFINALITFTANPRKYPGSIFIYNAFVNELPAFQSAVPYRARIYRRYEILPTIVATRANSQNNTLIDITVTGIVLGSNEND